MNSTRIIKLTRTVVMCAVLALCAGPRTGAAQSVQDETGPTCLICHGEVTSKFGNVARVHNGSVHARFDVTCVDCHGGDPTQVEWQKSMSPQAGFKGRFTALESVTLCASCHNDYEKMRQFGIPIDQLQQYKTSEHGKALFLTGNSTVAVCTSCHGVHDILDVRNPKSSVYPLNVPETCAQCHADKKLMAPFGVSTDVVPRYWKGVHGKNLKKLDLAAPTCATCHGNHGAAPPGVAEVVNVCGRCHVNIREQFKLSLHFKKGLECINCHNPHENDAPTTAMFKSKKPEGCLSCHAEPKSAAITYIDNTLKELNLADADVKHAAGLIADAERKGFYVDTEKVLLREGETALIEFRNVQHAMHKDSTDTVLSTAMSKSQHIRENIRAKAEVVVDRKIIMTAIVGYLLLVLLLIFIKYLRMKRAYLNDRARNHA